MHLTFLCPPSMQRHWDNVQEGEYDIPYNHPRPVILDVGANIGGFAVWAVRRWQNCEIHSYEPLPDNFAVLKENVGIVKEAWPQLRMHIHNFAIGDTRHKRMFPGRNNCGEASFFDLGQQQTGVSIAVETRAPTLLPPAQILKMDTEGCEVEILRGLPALNFDAIMLEYHSEANRRAVDALLPDYVLVGSYAYQSQRGTVKYLHKRVAKT